MNQLELQRKKMADWNNNRAKNEKASLNKYFILKELFHPKQIIINK